MLMCVQIDVDYQYHHIPSGGGFGSVPQDSHGDKEQSFDDVSYDTSL